MELDFHNEAHNQEKFAALFKHLHFVKVSLIFLCRFGCGEVINRYRVNLFMHF